MTALRALWRAIAALMLILAASHGQAAVEAAGVPFEETANVAGQTLSLNGAGVRTKMVFKVYAMGLYLPERTAQTAAILASPGVKRIRIVTLRDLGADQFVDALIEGLTKNLSTQEMAAIRPAVEIFRSTMLGLKETPKGTEVLIDSIPGSGTRLTIDGKRRGEDIGDERLYPALLRIWLGEHPAASELKQALLGKAN